jgi:hypothetical protein
VGLAVVGLYLRGIKTPSSTSFLPPIESLTELRGKKVKYKEGVSPHVFEVGLFNLGNGGL